MHILEIKNKLKLSKHQFLLMEKLFSNPNHLFLKQELIKDLNFRSTRELDGTASELRRKFLLFYDTNVIINIWGLGYKWTL